VNVSMILSSGFSRFSRFGSVGSCKRRTNAVGNPRAAKTLILQELTRLFGDDAIHATAGCGSRNGRSLNSADFDR
jgi:hypothetical protein